MQVRIFGLLCGNLEVVLIQKACFCKFGLSLNAAVFWLLNVEFVNRLPFKALRQNVPLIESRILLDLWRESYFVFQMRAASLQIRQVFLRLQYESRLYMSLKLVAVKLGRFRVVSLLSGFLVQVVQGKEVMRVFVAPVDHHFELNVIELIVGNTLDE